MKLIVFDFDGTLARTDGVDGECFIQAFDDACQIRNFNTQWTDYEHITDEGITRDIFLELFGRHPHPQERERIVDHFLGLLSSRCDANSMDFAEVPGASTLMHRLREGGEWGVAVATGAWRRSLEFKARRAGLPILEIPSASAEDGPSRESIVLTAIERAALHYRQHRFERVVSVGDALWDVRTARKLELPFIGIGDESRAQVLQQEGASHVLADYQDIEKCLQYFDEARMPA